MKLLKSLAAGALAVAFISGLIGLYIGAFMWALTLGVPFPVVAMGFPLLCLFVLVTCITWINS